MMIQTTLPNVLLVDDITENLIALEAVLDVMQLNIIKAASGGEALRQVLEHDFAVILLDIHMPVMNGLETAKLIRLREHSKNTPIIFVTAYETKDREILEAYSVGAVDILLKPIIPEILLYKVEVFVNLFNHNRMLLEQAQQLEQINAALEEQLTLIQQLNHTLADANEQLEAFVYSATHDLRAPLRIIRSFGKILLEKHVKGLNPEGRNYLERMVSKAQSMAFLVDDLLTLAYTAQSELQYQEVNLSHLCQEVIEDLQALSLERQVEVRIQPNVIAMADGDLIKIALDNLLRNAWKFTAKCDYPVLEFGCIQHQQQRVYLVRDNGAGFEMEQAERLFKPFQRLHSKTDFEGTGIGLTIVRRIIERHGGNIWFEAAVNHGVTFYFTLSASPPKKIS